MAGLAKTIALFGSSGGAGATTIAVNLAAGLPQHAGGRVLLLDAHTPMPGDAGALLGVERPRAVGELLPTLSKLTPDLLASYAMGSANGLGLMLLVGDPQQARQVDGEAVRRVMELARAAFSAVVLDLGWPGALTPTLLDQTDVVCLVVEPSTSGLQRGRSWLEYFRSQHLGREAVTVALNRLVPRSAITAEFAQSYLQVPISAAIPEDSSVLEAAGKRQPVLITHPRHAASRELDRLVRAVWARGLRAAQLKRGEDEQALRDRARDLKVRLHRRLIQEVNLPKSELDSLRDPIKLAEMRRRTEAKVVALLDEEAGELLDRESRRRLTKEMLDEAFGLGPLEDLLADPEITEIMINGPNRIFVERRGRLEETTVRFLGNEQLRGTIERIVAPIGRRIDEKVPLVDARLADGSRVNAIIPPLALDGPALTIRKFSKSFLGITDLIRLGAMTAQMAAFLEAAVRARQNVVVAGGTGSGKTTLLNLLASHIPEDERIITVEDSAELRLHQSHVVRLESRPPNIEGEGAITIRDLVRNALRMRPDRIVVGECRGGETLDMLQAMNTGHDGSLTTVHANTPLDTLARIETMSLMAGLDLPSRAIRDQIVAAVHLIVQQARLADGSRRITHISEVQGMVDGSFAVADIFLFRQTGLTPDGRVVGQFLPTGHVPRFVDQLSRRGISLPREIFLHQTA